MTRTRNPERAALIEEAALLVRDAQHAGAAMVVVLLPAVPVTDGDHDPDTTHVIEYAPDDAARAELLEAHRAYRQRRP